MKNSIGNRIRKFRDAKELSQENLAYELGLSRSAYNKIETGSTSPNVKRLEEIAKILEIDVRDLFEEGKTSTAQEPKTQYGFATKGDFEELVNMIKEVTKELYILKANVQRLEDVKPKSKKN